MDCVTPMFLWCAGVVDMDALAPRHLIFASQKSFTSARKSLNSVFSRSICSRYSVSRFRIRAKRSRIQDFQDYAKPSHLLQASEVEICTKTSIEKILSSMKGDESHALFKVDISTSKLYGSSLSDMNAGILLCLIDEKGNSILQRIPASLTTDHYLSKEKDILDGSEILLFQRGSSDEFVLKGPKLGRLESVWLSVDSGQWRLGSLSLYVISQLKSEGHELQYMGFKYEFSAEDILLGEGSDKSMVELRSCLVSEVRGIEPLFFLNGSSNLSNLATIDSISNEESMKEYADLKLSLLTYDALLIFAGTSISSFSAGENAGLAFLAGGILGFLYLLLLQRSVDELPAPTSNSERMGNEDRRYIGPLSVLALAVGLSIITVKFNLGDSTMMLSPKEVVIGMLGFLACKVAVVLAAVKPMALGRKVNE
ncbi:uncharacterized protein LOC111485461 [Cucurbita maxima]|uniref:Uncharacterized protein LOC111485461 n=1 Tax=Cucurbita maxima TaxID=3661 RepID=A0A6J1JGB7_CUCMA|nr:uncharacterized protein LOC111485461 [Cucurbita maxima]